MRVEDLSLWQSYLYKGWGIGISGKQCLWKNQYEFHVSTSIAGELLTSFFAPLFKKIECEKDKMELLLYLCQNEPKHQFSSYTIIVKKKLFSLNLLDAPYVREAIRQANSNVDTLGDALTFIRNHAKEFEQIVLSITNQFYGNK